MSAKESQLRGIIANLTPEEKAGQLFVVDFCGATLTPHLVNMITKYNVAGLRVQDDARLKDVYHGSDAVDDTLIKQRSLRDPSGFCKDTAFDAPAPRMRASEYASVLNKVKEIAMNRRHGIPLHIALDQENTGRGDYTCGNLRLFPPAMGMAATGNPALVHRAYKAMAQQLKSVGFSMIHSPVVDVNTNPKNPEVGIRSFSDRQAEVIKYAKEFVKAFNEVGIISTAKHYPGRGESEVDAHFDLPEINVDRDVMFQTHLSPYAELMKVGVPAVMVAHTIYPTLEKELIPATTSRTIVTDILKKQFGHKGIITTDNLLMAGLIKKYEIADACILALRAGCTLLLPRVENPLIDELYWNVVKCIKNGDIDQVTLDEAIYTNLSVKWDFGLFKNGGLVDPKKADRYQELPEPIAAEREVSQRAVVVLKNDKKLLPLDKKQTVLLVDQAGPVQKKMNNFLCHPGIFWEKMLATSPNVRWVEIDSGKKPDAKAIERVMKRVPEADVIIATDWEVPRGKKTNHELLAKLAETGKPLVVVTNSPFRMDHAKFATVVVCWTDAHEAVQAVSEILYGKRKVRGKLPVGRY